LNKRMLADELLAHHESQ